ncbi:family 2 glycosyl transferase [Parasporobacterium paucivorans]|uniref:Family 2 glycosyl transferase n=1 Tax=Parasporobacterium paucivorans DSM 15970 TaxID=1122934 RepID=A0A1M6JYZ0_9FIRM|nr:family 2 glycosyl transferase [Parasporobacterium paucivorans]SHJ51878.1 hypothetical protein SAMN02745691_02092 [Parasporobacterium paucivorans DSM 15970]
MTKNRKLFGITSIVIALAVGGILFLRSPANDIYEENGLKYISKVEGKDFLIYEDGKWQKNFLTGVNMGSAKPGYFPGELAITKEEYMRWFQYISDMNAEVIRVYTTLKPEFYDALYDFNRKAEKPLYLMQGVWVKEEDIAALNDAYANNDQIMNEFMKDAMNLVDIIHGNATLPAKPGFASGEYKSDVSEYVIGWILGIEWDPEFVDSTNQENPGRSDYSGRFLATEGASPFEAFLCEVGDNVLEYEASSYKMTRALSFTNWLTTDMLDHPNEPYEMEDFSVVNMEHIKPQKEYKSGLFASYHIYPYYPDFMNYQVDYGSYRDEEGNINTYEAYLKDLIARHTMPVLVAEFGVPASRGKAHENRFSGYNQGFIDEKQQGEILADLLQDISAEGYCGAIVFSWQDEWFKRTWNTVDFDVADRRPFWSNPQTNEQEFGLMAFDPGEKESICYVDGDVVDWSGDSPLYTWDGNSLYVKSDEKYLYILAKTKDYDFTRDTLYIPVDTIQGQGNAQAEGGQIALDSPADFLIQISGKEDSRILVDAYYDSFYYLYAEKLKMLEKHPEYSQKNSGIFNGINLCLSSEIHLPQTNETIPFSKYETGILRFGDANPGHEGYNSLTDFSVKDGNVEIRIAWQLLNVMDPSTKQIISDLYKNQSIEAETIKEIRLGAGIQKAQSSDLLSIGMKPYSWESWEMPTYHERLKPSYYILKDVFEEYND